MWAGALLVACGGEVAPVVDGGGGMDAQIARDAGSRDGGATPEDAGEAASDAAIGVDAARDLDAGPDDAGAEDASAGEDAAIEPDAGMRGCTENSDCTGSADHCLKADGDCDGRGMCTSRPITCPADIDPVCGCDGTTYDNACGAHAAGVNVRHLGACGGGSTCTLPPRSGCCFEDGDCGSRGQRCVGATCSAGDEGTCVMAHLAPGECWEDSDCPGGACMNVRRCPCGVACLLPDEPGTCAPSL